MSDLRFVFTGELERWTRDEVTRHVESYGAQVTSSVSGETDYVVAGPRVGSKLEEARERDIAVMDESEFVEFLQDHDALD